MLEICQQARRFTRGVYFVGRNDLRRPAAKIPDSRDRADGSDHGLNGINKVRDFEKYLALYSSTCTRLSDYLFASCRVDQPFGPFQTSIKNQGVIARWSGARCARDEAIEIWGDGLGGGADFILLVD